MTGRSRFISDCTVFFCSGVISLVALARSWASLSYGEILPFFFVSIFSEASRKIKMCFHLRKGCILMPLKVVGVVKSFSV